MMRRNKLQVNRHGFQNIDCRCIRRCSANIDEEQRRFIFDSFHAIDGNNYRNRFLSKLIKKEGKLGNGGNLDSPNEYYLNIGNKWISVCRNYILDTFQITFCHLSRILRPKKNGQSEGFIYEKELGGCETKPNLKRKSEFDFRNTDNVYCFKQLKHDNTSVVTNRRAWLPINQQNTSSVTTNRRIQRERGKSKVFLNKDCMCKRRCLSKISEGQRRNMFYSFWEIRDTSKQNSYLHDLVETQWMERILKPYDGTGLRTDMQNKYFMNIGDEKISVCKKYVLLTFQICKNQLSRALSQGKESQVQQNFLIQNSNEETRQDNFQNERELSFNKFSEGWMKIEPTDSTSCQKNFNEDGLCYVQADTTYYPLQDENRGTKKQLFSEETRQDNFHNERELSFNKFSEGWMKAEPTDFTLCQKNFNEDGPVMSKQILPPSR